MWMSMENHKMHVDRWATNTCAWANGRPWGVNRRERSFMKAQSHMVIMEARGPDAAKKRLDLVGCWGALLKVVIWCKHRRSKKK
jgi:hypothetical protein